MIVGLDKFSQVDIRVRVSGGGHTSQVYAVRQAIAKALIAYYQKYVDERKSFPRHQARDMDRCSMLWPWEMGVSPASDVAWHKLTRNIALHC